MYGQARLDANEPKKTDSIPKRDEVSVVERAQAARRYAELLAESGVRIVQTEHGPVLRRPYTEELIPHAEKIREAERLRKGIPLKQSEIADGIVEVFGVPYKAAKELAERLRLKAIWHEHDYRLAIEAAEKFTDGRAANAKHAAKKAMVWMPREKEIYAAEMARDSYMLMGAADEARFVMEIHGLPPREMLRGKPI